jgi:antitoxin (DNA-binding transcriptional repressor) of toxin-antitoxin stability system
MGAIRSLFIVCMKTLTATEARKNLTRWLKAAKNGEEIGIVYGAAVIALRPVPIHAADYPQAEYGATGAQLAASISRLNAELDSERQAGQMKTFTGKLPKRRGR